MDELVPGRGRAHERCLIETPRGSVGKTVQCVDRGRGEDRTDALSVRDLAQADRSDDRARSGLWVGGDGELLGGLGEQSAALFGSPAQTVDRTKKMFCVESEHETGDTIVPLLEDGKFSSDVVTCSQGSLIVPVVPDVSLSIQATPLSNVELPCEGKEQQTVDRGRGEDRTDALSFVDLAQADRFDDRARSCLWVGGDFELVRRLGEQYAALFGSPAQTVDRADHSFCVESELEFDDTLVPFFEVGLVSNDVSSCSKSTHRPHVTCWEIWAVRLRLGYLLWMSWFRGEGGHASVA